VHRLQTGSDPECRLFQQAAEQGHYGGRTKPTNTRQGIYAIAPSGAFLASVNTRSADAVAQMLRTALERFEQMPDEQRFAAHNVNEPGERTQREQSRYPEDGLALRVFSRDLPRPNGYPEGTPDWQRTAWNMDHVWFTREEVMSLVPDELSAGKTAALSDDAARRLVALHVVDNVRGQVSLFENDDVRAARFESEMVRVDGDLVHLRLTGETRATATGKWPVNGMNDANALQAQRRGIETEILGFATFDRESNRFTEFELIATGMRWGATQYNQRDRDLGPHGIGFYFTISPNDDRIAPANFWRYRW